MSCWPPPSPESCNSPFFFFFGLGDKGADKKIGWDREQARTICTEFFSVTRSLGGAHSTFIMQAAPGNSWQVPNDALPVGRLRSSPFLCPPPPRPQSRFSANTWEPFWALLFPFQCPRNVDDRGFTTAQNGAFCFLLDYSKFGGLLKVL